MTNATNETRDYETISGARQSRVSKWYDFTTSEVKDFIQKRFTHVDNALIAKGAIREDEAIDIDLISITPEKTFVPFLLILPINVLVRPKRRNIPEIFQPDHSDGVDVQQIYYELFKPFMFDRDDAKAFRTSVWKNEHAIRSFRTVNILHRYSTPKIIGNEDGNLEENVDAKVVVILDPIRVFHKMLEMKRVRQDFSVYIGELTKILDDNNYEYKVKRVVHQKKKNHDLEKDIMRYVLNK